MSVTGSKRTSGKTDAIFERFRNLCLRLPETTEAGSWGHPNFRAGKLTFATIEWTKDRPSLALRLGEAVTTRMLAQIKLSFATPYGRGQWLSIWVDGAVDWRLVEVLVDRSYRLVALKRMVTALDSQVHKDEGIRSKQGIFSRETS
jgi:predicted DNA-binding protein (MmcQ/YjbR family)